MDDTEADAPARTPHSGRPMPPLREDCWSEAATLALIQAWGDRYVELNRGNLKQKHWQEVADAVNARSAGEKTRKTDVQCKNRIDTLKKKYKIEKARVVSTNRAFISKWPYYNRIDDLLGPASAKKLLPSQAAAAAAAAASAVATVSAAVMKVEPPLALPLPYRPALNAVPVVAAVRAKDKRPAAAEEEYVFRRIPMEAQSGSSMSPDSPESSRESGEDVGSGGRVGGGHGLRKLAKAIMKFTEIYEKVESAKQKQMMDLERQKMEFTKSLEYQKMQLFMDMQVELTKFKRVKRENFL